MWGFYFFYLKFPTFVYFISLESSPVGFKGQCLSESPGGPVTCRLLAPPPEMLIQQAWGGAEEFAFLTLPRCCWCCITRICTNRRIFGKKKRKKIVFFHLILNLYQCSPFCFNIWCFLYKVISKTHPNTEIKKICSWPPLHTPVPFPRAGWSVLAADDVRTAQSKALDLAPVCVELKLWVCRGIFVHKDA